MKKVYSIPLLLLLFFAAGIFSAAFLLSYARGIIVLAGVSTAITVFLYLRAGKRFLQDSFFGCFAMLTLFLLGALTYMVHQPSFKAHHYLHQSNHNPAPAELVVYRQLKPSTWQDNYIAEVRKLNHRDTRGKILLNVAADSLNSPLRVGDRIVVYEKLLPIAKPLNPHQFDYASFMENQQVYAKIATRYERIYKKEQPAFLLLKKTADLRNSLQKKIRDSGFTTSQSALIEALILGQRSSLSEETYTNFIDAGVVHILAVSGLHVGILLLLLLSFLRPVQFLPQGKLLQAGLAVLVLWMYAFVTGLSPSVLRAVTMFSFLSFGISLKRRVFSINMLCLSALVLLIYNPQFIYQVGFQLSYAAVFSILVFQKKIYEWFTFKTLFFDKLWQISSVTLSAQLGVLPLSLYYFHQFPGLFFVSNLLIIPFLGIILGTGVVLLIWMSIFPLPVFTVRLYGAVLDGLETVVRWLGARDQFLFRHVYFSTEMLILAYLLLILLMGIVFKQDKRRYLFAFLCGLILFQAHHIRVGQKFNRKQAFYVFHRFGHSVMGVQKAKKLRVLTAEEPASGDVDYRFLDAFMDHEPTGEIVFEQPENFYVFGRDTVLIIDSDDGWFLPENIDITLILLKNSPRINLDRVISTFRPRLIIADGSNYNTFLERWQKTCAERQLPFHNTAEKGYFVLDY